MAHRRRRAIFFLGSDRSGGLSSRHSGSVCFFFDKKKRSVPSISVIQIHVEMRLSLTDAMEPSHPTVAHPFICLPIYWLRRPASVL
jgi:hypothetical protein